MAHPRWWMEFSKMTINSNKISTYEFLRSLITNLLSDLQSSIRRMKFSKITVKSVQNIHPWVLGVTDYEFIVIFTKFNIANSRWWLTFRKNNVKSD